MAQLTATNYAKLERELGKILGAARAKAEAALASALVEAYWRVGERVEREQVSVAERAQLVRRLAVGLAIDPATLRRAIALHRTYPRLPTGPLAWGHYRLLLPLKDRAERKHYERLVARESLSVRELTLAIDADSYRNSEAGAAHASARSPSGKLRLVRPTDPGYIYRAQLERVIDGDTLILQVDLGFGVTKRQRLRLAHIDTPPLDSPGGQAAFAYVQQLLGGSRHLAVKTHQIDVYGRYIAHLFHSPRKLSPGKLFLKGAYLNQQLLSAGHATPM